MLLPFHPKSLPFHPKLPPPTDLSNASPPQWPPPTEKPSMDSAPRKNHTFASMFLKKPRLLYPFVTREHSVRLPHPMILTVHPLDRMWIMCWMKKGVLFYS